jgi:Predicted transcriptional regulators
LVPSLLKEFDKYGYEIIKELDIRSGSTFQFKEGTLYPVLHKLENSGYVKSYISKSDAGKQRKYYRITDKGRKQLVEEKKQWKVYTTSVNKVIGGELHVFA